MEFEFDLVKSEENKDKHGIDFEEAKAIWNDPETIEFELPFAAELRHMVIGKINDRHWSAIITYREDSIRLISVRRSRRSEEVLYDNSKRF
ncbi:MAG: BrnT family toxin [Acidobacteriota bacterium]|nr:MAG: BrnT family toxin [Acidobacteriota bacterium]